MTDTLLLQDLSIAFAGQASPAVSGLSISIKSGQTLALVGESGSGKTLTGLSILGLLPNGAKVSSGKMLFCPKGGAEVDLATLSRAELHQYRGAQIGMVFQEPLSALNPVMTVGSQAGEVLRAHTRLSRSAIKERVCAAFAEVQLPEGCYSRYPHELSGGQRQRVMIAQVLVAGASLVIADEPTTALDVTVQAEILKLLRRLQQTHNLSLLFITHDLTILPLIADEVAVLRYGKLLESGTVKEVLTNPRQAYSQILTSVFRRADVVGEQPASSTSGRPLVQIKNLTVSYRSPSGGAANGIRNLNLSINLGETLGLVGESGSGKTTLARTLVRLLKPSAGEILLNGKDIKLLSGEKYSTQVQYIFQDPGTALTPHMRIVDALTEVLRVHEIGDSLAGRVQMSAVMLDRVGLAAGYLERYPYELSGGQRQRVCIARALLLKPLFVICDECTSALDAGTQADVLQLLAELKAELNLTYLFITHDLELVQRIADRVAVLRKGCLEEYAPTQTIFSSPQSSYTQALLAANPTKDLRAIS